LISDFDVLRCNAAGCAKGAQPKFIIILAGRYPVSQIRRQVAVKLLKIVLNDLFVVAHFEKNHPVPFLNAALALKKNPRKVCLPRVFNVN
jgi:hypothetical protein